MMQQRKQQRGMRWPVLVLGLLSLMIIVGIMFIRRTSEKKAPTAKILKPFPSAPAVESAKVKFADFAGSEACKDCHADIYNVWKQSTHGQAGGLPGEVKMIARFDGRPLYFKDATVYPRRKGKNTYEFLIKRPGKADELIPVTAIVGGGHMHGGGTQSFFTELPDGSYRFLPFDYIRDEGIWFVQLRKNGHWVPISRDIALPDLLNWPPHRLLGDIAGTSNCQNCHGSQIITEADGNQFDSRFATLAINCESCHGPGKRHIERMRSGSASADIGMAALATVDKDQSLNVCFQCHAQKSMLKEGFLPGDDLESFYSLKLPILGNAPYLPDGKVASFAYQQNHLFSDCYVNGSMTCVDCHDPHNQGYRDIYGKVLKGKFDNGQCTGCHASKANEPEMHSKHKPGSAGDLCTSCHMPFLQHRGLGDQLRFARSDHTIPVPRPGLESAYGIENACQQCHENRSIDWIKKEIDRLWGPTKPLNAVVDNLLAADSVNGRLDLARLLLKTDQSHPIAEFTNLGKFVRGQLRPDMGNLEPEIIDLLKKLGKHRDQDLRALALSALHLSRGNDPAVRDFLVRSLASGDSAGLGLRDRWTLMIDYFGGVYASEGRHDVAIKAYNKALAITPEDAVTLGNLARSYEATNNLAGAITAYQRAINHNPQDASLYFKCGRLYALNNQIPKAIESIEQGLRYDPQNAEAMRVLQQLKARR